MNSDKVGNALLVVLAVCALIVTGAVVRREFVAPTIAEASTSPVALPSADWGRYSQGGERRVVTSVSRGPQLTIVEFSDFQCPYCKAFSNDLRRAVASHTGGVTWVFHQFPLETIHPHAKPAALTAICAGRQGAFWQMHDLLFDNQDSLGHVAWTTLAARAGVRDTSQLLACIAGPAAAAALESDVKLGHDLGVRGTPTVLINGLRFQTPPDSTVLDSIVRNLRKG
jgi:protein-disulfide isomerase